MAKQRKLDYSKKPDYSIENFYVGADKLSPFDIILNPDEWGGNVIVISGDKGSGKTHLAHIYSKHFNSPMVDANVLNFDMLEKLSKSGCVIDNIEQSDEDILFHLINMAKQNNSKLFFTIINKVKDYDFKLPDLKSRLLQAMVYNIEDPTDEELHFVLLKNFADRELAIKSDVMSYIIERMPRSYDDVNKLVEILDDESLARSSEITIPFVRTILSEYF